MDGVMKMMQIDGLDVPSQGVASLEPGGNHVMLLGVQDRLTEGQTVLVTLRYANGDTQTVELPVKRGEPMQHGEHNMNHDNN
ncbi:MAG: copper chaperone PCu(A)C [Pseudomonadota bacterium]